MLRPVGLDILGLLLPLVAGALAFWVGRRLRRWPVALATGMVALAVGLVILGGGSMARLLPDGLEQAISQAGGATILLSGVALLLLGVAWSAPARRISAGFLASLVALAGCLILIETSGPLWWRYCAAELWERVPDANGRLRQSSSVTCSPAAAAMLLHRYGIRASEGEMAYLAGTSLFGTDAPAMARALQEKVRERRWQARARHSGYAECVGRGEPFLAHLRGSDLGHAVLVEGVSWEQVEIVDPLEGSPRRLSREEFEGAWDGTVIEIVRRPE
jgi:hypothetical protein